MSDFSRIPVTVIEIDQDLCCLSWKETNECGTCNADGDEPCWNTRATCQALSDYELGDPLTLRFSMRDRAERFDEYVIPSVDSVRTDPTRINVGGRRGREEPLGMRAQASIDITDHPHSDLLVDPYLDQRSYDPLERSTFWAKWLRRNPFYINRPLRIREGFEDQALAEMQTRHYVIEKIEGPSADGRVKIRAQDVLRLADNDKAKAPELSNGILNAGIDENATSLVVTRGTEAEYTQYGTSAIRIGDEVIRYSSVTTLGNGNLSFTGLVRGTDGSEASDHDAEDTVQACLEYVNQQPWVIAHDLLTEFGGVPSQYINLPEWSTEGLRWLASYPLTRLITEPTGVTTLVGELSEQSLFYIWWDEFEQEIKFRAVAPTIGDVPVLSERGNLIQGTTDISVQPEQRASEVWISFLPLDATEDQDKRNHFRRTRVRVDADSSSEFEYGDRRVYEVYSRWLTTDIQASLLAFRLLSSYLEPPKYVRFSLDVKDRDIAHVGDEVDIEYRGFVDDTGLVTPVRYRIISAHESPPGQRVKIEAQQSQFGVGLKFGRIMENDAPTYDNASEEEINTGMFIAQNDGLMPNGDDPYLVI